MPAKKKHFLKALAEQEWIEPYMVSDPCLFDELIAAYVARGRAQNAGATATDLAHGDRALASIKDGDVRGSEIWGRAAVAIRRFGEAYGARRARCGHALKRRYGKRRMRKEV